MLRAGALMVALLVLAPFPERSEWGHLPLLCEGWPGHLKAYQQLLIASDNDSYKTSVNRIPEQSALKKYNRNYKSFRMNFKIHGKSAIKKHQLRYAIQFKINLNLVGVKKNIHISKKQLTTFSNILMARNYLRRLSMLINTNLKDCKVKMNWYINMRKKFEGNKSHASYLENGCKYMETRSPMSYMEHQANILRSEELLQKSQKNLESMLKFTKQHKGEDHIETNILKEKCKNSIDSLLASVKEKFCKVIINKYNKNLHRIVSDEQKILNRGRKKYIGFKSLQQEKNIKEKIKMWKWKTSKKSIYANQKLQFRYLFTYQKNSDIQKVYSTHKMFNIQRKKIRVFQTKIYRNKHLIQKWNNIVSTRKESKFGENEMGTLFKNCYIYFSIINLKFLTITICMKQDFFSSRKYQTQQLIQVKKMLQYMLPSSERVKKKYFSQKGLKMSFLKTPMVKQLTKKEGFPGVTYRYFYKDIFNSPSSTLERTKRSEEGETESVSVGALKHVSNALIAGAILFGIALFIIVLAGFYLYFKRRLVLKFFNTVLKDGKSSPKSKSTDAQGYVPISVSQNFHFVQPKDTRKKKTAMAKDVEAHTKDHVAVKKIYDSSDSEESSIKSHRGLSVRSRAYVFPSRSSGSVQSFYDDVCDICSAQFSLSDEFIVEKPYSNLSSTTPKAKETVSVACQTDHWVKDDQNYINTDMSPQLKKPTISRSKSENDIVKASSSNTSRPVPLLTHVSDIQNP